jgi:ubiquinol-cytochrome c reductase cytochrome b subunit
MILQAALYEPIPGGSRWRYVWGSTLVVAFLTQVVTGVFLWMAYSPSTQTAWESVFYIQHEMTGGWLLRGIHHYMASAMVVLLALHFLQVVWDGAYRAPRELNFVLGLLLMLIVLALALTGYLLPWDQKGYWATSVGTNLASQAPLAGPEIKKLAIGGSAYGHLTLTRFFALHAGMLPGLLVLLLVLHVALFRRHGIHARVPHRGGEETFWPDQVLKDSVAALAVLATVLGLTIYFGGAELMAPADPANPYDAARPEWYFLFLFQFLKWFPGER